MILPTLWISTANKLAPWSLSVFSKNLNVSPSSWLSIQVSERQRADGLLDELRHPNSEKYPNQSVLVVALDGYVYLVPYVEESDYYFLKTVIPSRKATRDYLLRSTPDEKT